MFKYKHIQAAHEIRMWIVTIATGVAAANMMLERHPEVREKIRNTIDGVKEKFTKEEKDKSVIKVVIVSNEES